jgi:hypothetical protein
MQIKSILALGALTLGVVLAPPASAQEPRACIHTQTSCSDAPYPMTQSVAPQSHRRLYDMVQPRVAPQQNAMQPCIHAQTSCM